MGKHLVLVGGGHAHLTTIVRIKDFVNRGHRVTVIGPSRHHYYSGMGPGMLGGFYRPEEIRFHIKEIVENRDATFLEDRILKIDPQARMLFMASGETLDYDVVSFNVGSSVPADLVTDHEESILTVKPIENLLKGQQTILNLIKQGKPRILVLGGGPGGLEIAGNVCKVVHDHGGTAEVALLTGQKLLDLFPAKAQRLAMNSLVSRGVQVLERTYVKQIKDGQAHLEDGRGFPFDLCLIALGVRPSKIFQDSGLPIGNDGGLLVNQFLQCVSYPEIFGGGDCISFQPRALNKVGVYAVRENPILCYNLMSALEEKELKPFDPGGDYLLIFNLGDGKAIFCRKSLVWHGRLAFRLKDYIDRRFMRKFQIP
jgi:NADH dehydrogenase FAD-containing subunit